MSSNNTEDTVFNGGLNEKTKDVVKKAAKGTRKVEVKPWQKVVIGGTAGFMLGAGGAYAASFFTKGDTSDEPVQEDAEGMKIAHNVDDSLSFHEAFDAARAEVGSGGAFYWHGGVYGTYTEDEWNALTPEQRDEFNGGVVAHVSGTPDAHQHADVDNAAAGTHADSHVHADAHQDIDERPDADTAQVTDRPDVESGELDRADVDMNSDVQIVGADDIVNEDGSVITVGAAIVDGREVYVVDVDHDGVFDVAGVDVNENGSLDDDEIIDISADNLQVSTFRTDEEDVPADEIPQDDLYADNSDSSTYSDDMSDYTNDASLV